MLSDEEMEEKLLVSLQEKENKKYIIKMTDEQYSRVIELVECDINKKWEDKIRAKIEEVKDGTFDAKIVLQSLLKEDKR